MTEAQHIFKKIELMGDRVLRLAAVDLCNEIIENRYKAPEIMDEMPGIGNSKEISDQDIAEVMSFIRNSWNNRASEADTTDIQKVRRKYGNRRKAFTMEEFKK